MRKVIFILAFVFLLSACYNTNNYNADSSSIPSESIIINTSEQPYPSNESIAPKYFTYPANSKEEQDISQFSIHWIDGCTAFGVERGENNLNLFVIDAKNVKTLKLNTNSSDTNVMTTTSNSRCDIRVIDGKLLISTASGFYTVDLNGNIEEIFVFEKAKELLDLPTEYLTSDTTLYPPVISDDLQYVAYFFKQIEASSKPEAPDIFWETVLIDLHSKTKTVLCSQTEHYSPESEDVSGKLPIAFTPDNNYLIYNSYPIYISEYNAFEGRINLATKGIVVGDRNGIYQVKKIINNDKVLLFEQGPPSFSVTQVLVYDFATSSFTPFTQAPLNAALWSDGASFIYNYSGELFVGNYNTGKCSKLPSLQAMPASNLSEVSKNGIVIEYALDENGDYVFAVHDLSRFL